MQEIIRLLIKLETSKEATERKNYLDQLVKMHNEISLLIEYSIKNDNKNIKECLGNILMYLIKYINLKNKNFFKLYSKALKRKASRNIDVRFSIFTVNTALSHLMSKEFETYLYSYDLLINREIFIIIKFLDHIAETYNLSFKECLRYIYEQKIKEKQNEQ